jgi:hypothetical protein
MNRMFELLEDRRKRRQRERLRSAYRIGNIESEGTQIEGIKAMDDGEVP